MSVKFLWVLLCLFLAPSVSSEFSVLSSFIYFLQINSIFLPYIYTHMFGFWEFLDQMCHGILLYFKLFWNKAISKGTTVYHSILSYYNNSYNAMHSLSCLVSSTFNLNSFMCPSLLTHHPIPKNLISLLKFSHPQCRIKEAWTVLRKSCLFGCGWT